MTASVGRTEAPRVAKLGERVTDLEQQRVTFVEATVVAVSPVDSTFTAEFPDGQRLAGVGSPAHFMPAVGDTVLLERSGALPIYQPGRVAAGAIGEVELAAPVRQKIDVAVDAANGKNEVRYSEDPPSDTATPGGTAGDLYWQVTPPNPKMTVVGQWLWDGTTWVPTAISDAVFTSVTAALIVTGRLGAGVEIAVGDPTTMHTVIDGTRGLVIQAPDAAGVQRELIRYGRDYAVIDPVTGDFLTSVDETGTASFQGLFTPWINLNGTDLATQLAAAPRGLVNRVALVPSATIGGMYYPYGLVEVPGVMYAGRTYRVDYRLTYYANNAEDSGVFTVRITGGNGGDTTTQPATPTINSTEVGSTHYEPPGLGWRTAVGHRYWDATYTSRYRFLLTAGRDAGNGAGSELGTIWIPAGQQIELSLTDMGPTPQAAGSWNNGGGTLYGGTAAIPPPSTPQQYFVDLAPAGWASFRGNGSQRTDYNGIVQGWDPSGYNGDGGGFWYFNLPSITGSVDRVDFYCYADHWYNNSGGTAIFNMVAHPAGANYDSVKLRQDWYQPGYPKGNGKTVILPADWWPQFKNTPPSGPRAVAITAGNGNGTNLLYYGRFQGPSARLRIWYTQ